jgi:hypothetical protein
MLNTTTIEKYRPAGYLSSIISYSFISDSWHEILSNYEKYKWSIIFLLNKHNLFSERRLLLSLLSLEQITSVQCHFTI